MPAFKEPPSPTRDLKDLVPGIVDLVKNFNDKDNPTKAIIIIIAIGALVLVPIIGYLGWNKNINGTVAISLIVIFFISGLYAVYKVSDRSQFISRRRNAKKLVAEAANWEGSHKSLEEFWVVLPQFIGGENQEVFDVMIRNIKDKKTIYTYYLHSEYLITKLEKVAKKLKKLSASDITNNIRIVHVESTQLSKLLHITDHWLANPNEPFDVKGIRFMYDEDMEPIAAYHLMPRQVEEIVSKLSENGKAQSPRSVFDSLEFK